MSFSDSFFMHTRQSRLIFRNLRGTLVTLGIVDDFAPWRILTHEYCLKYRVEK